MEWLQNKKLKTCSSLYNNYYRRCHFSLAKHCLLPNFQASTDVVQHLFNLHAISPVYLSKRLFMSFEIVRRKRWHGHYNQRIPFLWVIEKDNSQFIWKIIIMFRLRTYFVNFNIYLVIKRVQQCSAVSYLI